MKDNKMAKAQLKEVKSTKTTSVKKPTSISIPKYMTEGYTIEFSDTNRTLIEISDSETYDSVTINVKDAKAIAEAILKLVG